jgi:hypothetical protein
MGAVDVLGIKAGNKGSLKLGWKDSWALAQVLESEISGTGYCLLLCTTMLHLLSFFFSSTYHSHHLKKTNTSIVGNISLTPRRILFPSMPCL